LRFSLELAGLGSTAAGTVENKYLYNGKEKEDDLFANDKTLMWYHYGARYYDPQLGRWHSVDPVDEFHSPYAYGPNDPINGIYPDGTEWVLLEDGLLWWLDDPGIEIVASRDPNDWSKTVTYYYSFSDYHSPVISNDPGHFANSAYETPLETNNITLSLLYPRYDALAAPLIDPIDLVVGANIVSKIGAKSIADNAFVHVAPREAVKSITWNGMDPKMSSYLTKGKYVKHIENKRAFGTKLYRQDLWPSKQNKFNNGAYIFEINSNSIEYYGPFTNSVNGVPQWILTSPVPAKQVQLIKTVK
jgi:RHS repeat-associated protein